MDFLKIDGGHGEGGGQIIRSAIVLSCITKQPIHLENIRKNRKIQGLRPQHLTAIKILQKVANAKVIGCFVIHESAIAERIICPPPSPYPPLIFRKSTVFFN